MHRVISSASVWAQQRDPGHVPISSALETIWAGEMREGIRCIASHIHNWQTEQDENELWAWLVFAVIKIKFTDHLNSQMEVW